MNVISRHTVISLLGMLFFSEGVFAVASKNCQELIRQTESWISAGQSAAVQVAFNYSNQNESHLSFTGGSLNYYNPEAEPEIEGLLKRDQTGVFQSLPKFTMGLFEFEDANSSYSSGQKLLAERKDDIYLVLLSEGEAFVILRGLNKTIFTVTTLQCFSGGFFDPGYYVTGFIEEENGTTLVSLVVRNVSS